MASLEALLPTSVIQLGLALLALGLLFGAWLSRRTQVEPLGYWPLAWAVLVASGAMRVANAPVVFEYSGGAIFCALLLAGAYRYAGRPVPKALFPTAIGIAVVPLLMARNPDSPLLAYAVLLFSPLTILSACVIVRGALRERNASALHRLVPIGLLVLAALGVYDHLAMDRSTDSIGVWLLITIPIATNQAMAVYDRIRERADRTADELEMSVSLLQATLESTTDGILVVDTEGKYTSHNSAFRAMWGISAEVLDRGRSDQVLEYAKHLLKDPEGFRKTVKALYAQPQIESFDTLDFRDGRCIERYSRPQAVGDKIVGRVWSFRDVTARKHAEEAASSYRDHLEELVSKRTSELIASRDRLRQADRMVAIGTLAAGVAHQINNPVGAILNSAEYALLCTDDEDAQQVFREALMQNVEEAKRCGAIVRGMLQFARQEPVEKVDEDLNRVLSRAARAVDSYARDQDAEVRIELSIEALQVRVSPLEVEQVAVNLLRNAIESKPTGAVVSLASYRNNDTVSFEVSDNGVGIPEEDQARIFDPFFSTRLLEGGTGLGLSVAHGILKDHGGNIAVDSSPGKGTTFTVDLPLASN